MKLFTNTMADVTAGAAIFTPWWYPGLHTASELAAIVLPILGVIWLVTQIVTKWYEFYKGKNVYNEDDRDGTEED